MRMYPHHIGDFNQATRHCSRLERSVYRDLLDLYYDTEAPLPLDQQLLCRKVLAHTNEESTAVEQVLNEFFTKTPAGWFNARCDDEILKYRANHSQRAEAGRRSVEAKRLRKQQVLDGGEAEGKRKGNGRSTAVEIPSNGALTNQEPITNNQQPITKYQAKASDPYTNTLSNKTSPIPINWEPSPDTFALLKQRLVGNGLTTSDFAKDMVPEFVLYWRGRPEKRFHDATWNQKFLNHCNAQWQRFLAAKVPLPIDPNFYPDEKTIADLHNIGMDIEQINFHVDLFKRKSEEGERLSTTWNTNFYQWTLDRWTATISQNIESRIQDRSWAEG